MPTGKPPWCMLSALADALAGHAIGVIVADTEAAAQAAARAVEVTYTDIASVLSIEQAIETGSYFEVLLSQGVMGYKGFAIA